MYFSNPEVLYGLLAMLIPLIVHLFNFRRYKKVYFSNISLLKDISIETKKQNQLKHIIILIIRMLAIAMLVLAFAGPHSNKKQSASVKDNVIGIYIDNSFSLEAGNRDGQLFNHEIAAARELIKNSQRETKFIIVNNSSRLNQRPLNKDEALSLVDNYSISSEYKSINTIIDEFIKFKQKNTDYQLTSYLISDYQKSAINFSELSNDSLIDWKFVLLQQGETRNILIDSCWIENVIILPDNIQTLSVSLKNVSPQSYEKAGIKLFIDGQNKSIASVDLEANSSKTIQMQFNAGAPAWKSAFLEIEDYPISFDDQLFFAFKVKNKIKVLSIKQEESEKYVRAFYNSDSIFEFNEQNYKSLNYQDFNNYQLIILNSVSEISSGLTSQLKNYISEGGNLFIFPPYEDDISELNNLLKQISSVQYGSSVKTNTRVKGIKLRKSIFSQAIEEVPENADLPVVFKRFIINKKHNNLSETLVSLVDGNDFLVSEQYGGGSIFISAVNLSPDFSNLSSHQLFIPMMYGAATNGQSNENLFYTLDGDLDISIALSKDYGNNKDEIFSLNKMGSEESFIPRQNIKTNKLNISFVNLPKSSGIYELRKNNKLYAYLGLNYNRLESIMEFNDLSTLEEGLAKSNIKNKEVFDLSINSQNELVNSMQNESKFWLLFIIFALSLLLIEILILRFWH